MVGAGSLAENELSLTKLGEGCRVGLIKIISARVSTVAPVISRFKSEWIFLQLLQIVMKKSRSEASGFFELSSRELSSGLA